MTSHDIVAALRSFPSREEQLLNLLRDGAPESSTAEDPVKDILGEIGAEITGEIFGTRRVGRKLVHGYWTVSVKNPPCIRKIP